MALWPFLAFFIEVHLLKNNIQETTGSFEFDKNIIHIKVPYAVGAKNEIAPIDWSYIFQKIIEVWKILTGLGNFDNGFYLSNHISERPLVWLGWA